MDKLNNLAWYISKFPESLYLPKADQNKIYGTRVVNGKKRIENSTVLICGLARNIQSILPYTIARIERLGLMFKSFSVFIYENDSKDNTKIDLKKWENNRENITLRTNNLGLGVCSGVGYTRRVRMAFYRNQYLSYINSLDTLPDYIIILDMDIKGGWSYEGICNSFGQIEWDVITSNGILYRMHDGKAGKVLYDTWALRFKDGDEHNPKNNLLEYNRGDSIVKAVSGFGGLAIYKSELFTHNYVYTNQDCDHVTLHRQMCNDGYKVFLNPSQIVVYNKHMYNIV